MAGARAKASNARSGGKKSSAKPKASAKRRAAPKPKAQKGAATPERHTKAQGDDMVSGGPPPIANHPPDSGMKRRLDRRDIDEQVARVMKTKLYDQGYDEVLVESLRNARGQSIWEVVSEEIKAQRGSKRYLATSFWRKLFEEFPLKQGMFAHLPEAAGEIPEDLEDALLPAYSENPASRTIEPFLRYLDVAPKPTQSTLLALIRSCSEGPIVGRKQSHLMLIAVLKIIGKYQLQLEFPEIWRCISVSMDCHMTAHYKAWPLDEESYIGGHMQALSALMPEAAFKAVSEAKAKGNAISASDLQAVLDTKVGSAIFEKEAIHYRYNAFIETRDKLLNDLMGNSFEESQLKDFKAIMVQKAGELAKSGLKPYETKESQFRFLQQVVHCSISSLHDDWELGLFALAKTLAVSQGLVPRLPWEVVLFGDGPIDGVSETISPPEELLKMNVLARKATLKLFVGSDHLGVVTFSQMKTEVSKKRNELISLDRSFLHEVEFLFKTAEHFAETHVHADILKSFPGDVDETASIADTLQALQKLKHSRMVLASKASLLKEVESVISFVSGLVEGRAPAFVSISSMSSFFKSVLQRSEQFIRTSKTLTLPGKLFPVVGVVRGRPALETIYSEFIKEDSGDRFDDGKVLQAFRWLLTQEQNDKVDEKMKNLIRSRRSVLATQAALPAPPGGEGAGATSALANSSNAIVPQTVSAASSSIGSMAPKEIAKMEADIAARARLRAILTGKKA